MKSYVLLAAFAAVLSLSACITGTPAQTSVRQVVSTTSFGMCVGYCSTRLEITQDRATLIRSSRGGRGGAALPDQSYSSSLRLSEWREIEDLATHARINALPDRIGCPDCADGGAETLTIAGATERTITFEHGARIAEVQPLLDRVRALRERLMPREEP